MPRLETDDTKKSYNGLDTLWWPGAGTIPEWLMEISQTLCDHSAYMDYREVP